MAKDYFQDIVPPQGQRRVPVQKKQSREAPHEVPHEEEAEIIQPELGEDDDSLQTPVPERSIRNIAPPVRRGRIDDMRDVPQYSPPMPRPPRGRSRIWLWAVAGALILLTALLLLVALRDTTVTVVPRTHPILFDQSTQFTAFPSASAASGTLTYTVETVEIEDSEAVPSQGTVHAEEKASGLITVYNNHSASSIRLVKNTRFETSNGLIFRAPADIVIPGKQGSTPGSVDVTVVADQVGEQYNVAPGRFTIPGFRGSAEFTNVYAESTAAMAGGFSGERPGISESDMNAARASMRARLEQKAREAAAALNTDTTVAFSDLIRIEYQDMPNTAEAGGGARAHAKAIISIPVFPADAFARTIARSVSADADQSSVRLERGTDFAIHPASASSTPNVEPLSFTMSGKALIVWEIDAAALAEALAGRDQSAFQTVVTGFTSIQSARARIEPFWSKTFPADPEDIKVKVEEPKAE